MTHRPATNLRQECAAWLKASLGCQSVEINVSVASVQGGKASTVDLRGERYDRRWQRLKSSGVKVFLAAVVLQNVPPLYALAAEFSMTPNLLLVVSLLLMAVGHIGRVRTREYAWVQCRDFAKPVKRGDVQALHDTVGEIRRSGSVKWKPSEVIFATGTNGFDAEALELARSTGIQCYGWTDAGFEQARSRQSLSK